MFEPQKYAEVDKHSADTALLTPALQRAISAGHRREVALPLLLFVAGHRPLAFVVGQLLYLGLPGAVVLGWPHLGDWAALLSHPHGPPLLEQALLLATPLKTENVP